MQAEGRAGRPRRGFAEHPATTRATGDYLNRMSMAGPTAL